jgi:hypothetical protein
MVEAKRGMVQMVLPIQDHASRMHKGYCQGSDVNTAKLSEVDVRRIRARAALGESGTKIQADYPQVTKANVFAIIRGVTWRHVA